MGKVFEVNFAQGSYKDRISGTIPVNTGCVIKNTERGRAGYFGGSGVRIDTGLKPFGTGDITISLSFLLFDYGETGNFGRIFATDTVELYALSGTNRFVFASPPPAALQSSNNAALLNTWYHALITRRSDGISEIFINNVSKANGFAGTPSPSTENMIIGDRIALGRATRCFVHDIQIFDEIISSQTQNNLYQTSINAQTQLVDPLKQKALKEGSADSDVLLCDNSLNWNADEVTKSAGQFIGDWRVGSGTSRCKEDVTGKYIECVTNGTLIFNGIALSDIVGNGYVKKLTGDLSGFEGGTVAAAGLWTPNKLTLTMTAGQVLRNIVITRGA